MRVVFFVVTSISGFVISAAFADMFPYVEYDPSMVVSETNFALNTWESQLLVQGLSLAKLNAVVRYVYPYSTDFAHYPRATTMIAGICDTNFISIQFVNMTDSIYVLPGDDVYEWFQPLLHKPDMNIVNDAPVADSSILRFAARPCTEFLDPFNPPDTILAKNQSHEIAFDVWNIPEGVWVLSIGTTSKTPDYVNLISDGGTFEYRQPLDGQDTVNAYIAACFRSLDCRDFSDAEYWLDKALSTYPTSVPAWWSKASFHCAHGDSLFAFQAYDSAKYYYDNKLDPLLPDTTGSVKPVERLYMRAVGPILEFDRSGAEQNGIWK